MSNITLIIKREYLTRVKKKSFIIMTILGPILMAALMIVPVIISRMSDEQKTIAVIDEHGWYKGAMGSDNEVKFIDINTPIEEAKVHLHNGKYDALLVVPKNDVPNRAYLFTNKQLGLGVKSHIQNTMKYILEKHFIEQYCDLDMDANRSIEANNRIMIDHRTINESGKEESSSTEINTFLGLISGIIIYFFVFLFGSQVMRGVIEEKTSRIIEVIVSSVKPIQLMFGKIIGIAFVGLTQFLLWIIFTFTLVTTFQAIQPNIFSQKNTKPNTTISSNKSFLMNDSKTTISDPTSISKQDMVNELSESIKNINFGVMIFMFLFYFIGGYLLYGSLFAAIGSAVDNEADTQQFMLPITIPLIFALVMAQFVTNNPSGPVAYWLSIIPFTSPIIMMIRIPFGVPIHEVILSMTLLTFGFIFTTWLAAKIFRTGILMYGKKANYKEVWKWLRYKN